MILGVDTSTYFESKKFGSRYFKNGHEVEPLDIFRDNGVSLMRIRVWKDPYDENGKPYLGGTCDYANYIKLAKLAISKGYKIVLDPHFSDFWCDPHKQMMPKGWENLSENELLSALKEYAHKLFIDSKNDGVYPSYIQLGNEITLGTLWPYAKVDGDLPRKGYDKLIKVLKIFSKEARDIFPEAKLIIHLERSFDNVIYREFFDNVIPEVDFDIIGMSYYPYWHKTMKHLFANVDDLKKRYSKEIMIVEVGYGFTLEDYVKEALDDSSLVITQDMIDSNDAKIEFPLTPEGQKAFLDTLLPLAEAHGISGIIYWEPIWIPGEGICWASKEGQKYINELKGGTRNEWANQCLFDYSGNALPALDSFKITKEGTK